MKELFPSISLCCGFDHSIAIDKEGSQVAFQHERVCYPTENAEWGLEFKHVAHRSTAGTRFEIVMMLHALKRTANHGISEMGGTLERDNANGESLPYTEMPRSPRYLLPETDQARRDAIDCLFSCPGRGICMQVDAAGQIEDTVSWRGYEGGQFDEWHLVLITRQAFPWFEDADAIRSTGHPRNLE